MPVCKAYGKPFLLVGPYTFHDSNATCKDFFFVNTHQVIRSSADKGGNTFDVAGYFLFMLDDLTDCNRQVRSSIWDELKSEDASLYFDEARNVYEDSFVVDDSAEKISFTIPADYFTSDMINARTVL